MNFSRSIWELEIQTLSSRAFYSAFFSISNPISTPAGVSPNYFSIFLCQLIRILLEHEIERKIEIEKYQLKAGQARESVQTGTCSVPNTHEKQSQWVKARNGQAMNVRGLQLFGLKPPMILSWVTTRQVTLLMKSCIPCSLINL